MLRIRERMITGLAFLVYITIGMVIPWAFAAQDVDLVVASVQRPSAAESKKDRIFLNRGQFIKTEAFVVNLGPGSSGPFSVGIYLSEDPDGSTMIHEFDIIRDLDLSGSEHILISREYLLPMYITPARDYWVVFEADYDKNVTERNEKNKKSIQKVNVPCDGFPLSYNNSYLCPGGGDKFHFDD